MIRALGIGSRNKAGGAPVRSNREPQYSRDPKDNRVIGLLFETLLNPDMAETTVDALLNLDFGKPENEEAVEEFGNGEGCANLVQAMKNRADSASAQKKFLTLLIRLTFRSDVNILAFDQAGVTEVIVEDMFAFPDDEELQRMGCGALRNIAFLKSCREKVVKFKGMEAMLAAMEENSDNASLQASACRCLYYLAATSEENKNRMVELGFGPVVADTQQRFQSKDETVERAANALLNHLNKHD